MIPSVKSASNYRSTTWVFLQLLLLACGAGGAPLWSHHGFPREAWALQEMVCGQAILIGLLNPFVAANGRTLIINIAILMPMDELAGLLSNSPQAVICFSILCLSLWFAGLAGCLWLVRGTTSAMLITCFAAIFTLGGVVLDYLRAEAFANNGNGGSFHPISLLPALCSIGSGGPARALLESIFPIIVGLALLIVNRLRVPSTSLHSD